jgi:hypothetical protein
MFHDDALSFRSAAGAGTLLNSSPQKRRERGEGYGFDNAGVPCGLPGRAAPWDKRVMSEPDTPPDRLCNDPRSPYFNAEALARDVGIRFKGVEKTNVEEYCVSEGWVRVAAGKALDRHGNPLTIKLTGKVEAYYKIAKPG